MNVRACHFAELVASCASLFLAACGGSSGRATSTPTARSAANSTDSTVVARVGGRPIFAAEIARAARREGRPPRAVLDDRIRLELLALAAESRSAENAGGDLGGSARDDQQAWRSAMVERWMEDAVEPELRRAAIPEPEIHRVYERVKKRFVHGRLVKVAVLCIFTGARLPDAPRERARQDALRLREHVRRSTDDGRTAPGIFDAISKDPAWVERKVSLTTVWQDETEPFPRVVGEAVLRLTRPGDTTDLVGDETGYYLARYLAERPAEDISFEGARAALTDEMVEPWRRQRFLQLTLDLARGHDIDVDPEAFPLLVESSAAR